MEAIHIHSSYQTEFIDITNRIDEALRKLKVADGICYIYVPHTTAGVTINESADPSVREDIAMALDRMVPADQPYHHGEGNSPAHIKAALVGSSVSIFVESGRLVLGNWQGIYFCEFDGPRNRRVYVKVVGQP